MQICWRTCRASSTWHWARCIAQHRSLLKPPSPAVERAVAEISELAPLIGTAQSQLWDALLQFAPLTDSERNLAERTLARLMPEDQRRAALQSTMHHRIRTISLAFRDAFPDYDRESVLRRGPIEAQWEAYGPGLLHQLRRRLGEGVLVERADVILVQPVVGGAGGALLKTNQVYLEAVMADPDPRLPEVVRVAWLLGQLDMERPVHSEQIHGSELSRIAALALLPPVLDSAAELNLCEMDRDQVALALQNWWFERSTDPSLPDVLMSWWNTHQTMRPAWSTAIMALHQLLQNS